MDAGFGTGAQDRGVHVEGHPLWGSRLLLDEAGRRMNDAIHRAHVAAGAEMVIANTHNASFESCARWAGPDRAAATMETVNREAVGSARRSGARYVAACVMSADEPYAERATRSVSALQTALRPQVEVLDGLGVDLLIFEMLSTGADLDAARAVAAELRTPVAAGFTAAGARTRGGVSMEDAARRWNDRAAVVFLQCTPWPDVDRLLGELIDHATVPVGVYANAGSNRAEWGADRVSPDRYAEAARGWLGAGATAVGGCCGTSEAHIEALRRLSIEEGGSGPFPGGGDRAPG
jgi:S-methylmethionine-dependent homocysteine/selenocysteine methylase